MCVRLCVGAGILGGGGGNKRSSRIDRFTDKLEMPLTKYTYNKICTAPVIMIYTVIYGGDWNTFGDQLCAVK